jgi:hypothetical protein
MEASREVIVQLLFSLLCSVEASNEAVFEVSVRLDGGVELALRVCVCVCGYCVHVNLRVCVCVCLYHSMNYI